MDKTKGKGLLCICFICIATFQLKYRKNHFSCQVIYNKNSFNSITLLLTLTDKININIIKMEYKFPQKTIREDLKCLI